MKDLNHHLHHHMFILHPKSCTLLDWRGCGTQYCAPGGNLPMYKGRGKPTMKKVHVELADFH